MTANAFISGWEAVVRQERAKAQAKGVPEVADDLLLVSAPRQLLNVPSFPEETARFLVESGLPKSCAPFLSFEAVAGGPPLLIQHYGVHQFHPPDVERLTSFFVIGSDGAGNPLCVDSMRDGEVVMLDHADGFRTRTFVASNVTTLAQALLLLYTVPRAEFAVHLRRFDPRAAENSAYLPTEIAMMVE